MWLIVLFRIVGGWLIDRFWAPGVAFVMLSLPALACWMLAGTPSIDMARAAIFLIGFAAETEQVVDHAVAKRVGLTTQQIEAMYHVMAIANYEDRFVIPAGHREDAEDMFDVDGDLGPKDTPPSRPPDTH